MQEIVISNVKTAQYKEVNMNNIFDPDTQHNSSFEFANCTVTQPYRSKEGKLCVTFYTLEPGKSNYPCHFHTANEEVYYIISGRAVLETADGETEVSEGDVIVMPANKNGAHKLTNRSFEPVVYLDVDTALSPDVVFFPNSGKFRLLTEEKSASFLLESEVNYLHGE